jgi:sugar lactone lactonase YvrE
MTAVRPPWAIEGGRVSLEGSEFLTSQTELPEVRIGEMRARIVYASSTRVVALVPAGLESGRTSVRMAGDTAFVDLAGSFATGLHQVDNPVFDPAGNLFVTFSGTRGQQVPVSIFRVRPNGTRETFSSGIVNPTSMAISPDGQLYVSSRFEGTVYRVADEGSAEIFAHDLGVTCGLAFASDGTLLAGDRSGTIFRVTRSGKVSTLASLPSSVAAFHLAVGPDDALYVTGPTLSPYDAVYRISPDGTVSTRYSGFGRPQGLGFDSAGTLHVVEALAGASGLYRLPEGGTPELVLSGPGLVGVAFGPGTIVVSSNDTAYRLVQSSNSIA